MSETAPNGNELRAMQNPPYARGYVNYLSLLFFLTYGIIMLDASSVTFFFFFFMEQLHISTAQYAALNAVVWMAKAVSSIVVGLIANRTGHRKRYLAPLLLIAGVSSMLVVFAGSFFAILILRLLCGLCIGATLSMEMAILAKNISGRDYGLRSGFVSAGSAVIASALGPVLLTGIVMRWSWDSAFLFTGGMTFLMGVLVQCTVREVYFERQPRVDKNRDITVLLHNPVFLCCLLLGIFETAGKMILSTFGPLYLTEIMGLHICDSKFEKRSLDFRNVIHDFSCIVHYIYDMVDKSRIIVLDQTSILAGCNDLVAGFLFDFMHDPVSQIVRYNAPGDDFSLMNAD